jgi:TPR repeat protein
MKTKPLTFLLTLTFLFLFSGSSVVFGDDLQDAKDAFYKKDYETSYKLYLPLAKQGKAIAQLSIGMMYHLRVISKGQGIAQDSKEADKWFHLATEQMFMTITTNQIKNRLEDNLYLGFDENESVKWIRPYAEKGLAVAQYMLGDIYATFMDLGKTDEANKWYRLAADQGFPEAQVKIGRYYDQPPECASCEGESDYKEANKWYRLAADQGSKWAQYWLGTSYFGGTGVQQDWEEALKWFQLSADQGVTAAQRNVEALQEQLKILFSKQKAKKLKDLNKLKAGRPCQDCDLSGAQLEHAQLQDANLIGADLSGAYLAGANLLRANLTGANLVGADLIRADLNMANLKKANLIEAKLWGSNLYDANLIGQP